jgi:hypothetical protein
LCQRRVHISGLPQNGVDDRRQPLELGGLLRETLPACPRDAVDARLSVAGPGFARVLGSRTLAGRDFGPTDVPGGDLTRVASALVNRSFAEAAGSVDGIVGSEVLTSAVSRLRVVGVIDDFVRRADERPVPELIGFNPISAMVLMRVDPGATTKGLGAILGTGRRLWGQRASHVAFDAAAEAKAARSDDRARSALLSAMGVLAVVLALAGMIDAVSHAAEARRGEIALRLAIGARTRDIRSLLGRAALVTAVVGQAAGVAAAAALAATADAYFFGVQAVNVVAIVTAILGLLLAAGIANEVVVRRCARANLSLLLRSGD